MIKFNDFAKVIDKICTLDDTAAKLADIGIDIYDTPFYECATSLAEDFFNCHFNADGVDLIYWWLYEDVEKLIYDEHHNIVDNLTNIEDLFDYLTDPDNNYLL